MKHAITATCGNGHTQTITLEGLDREFAEMQAGLLDGTSPFYVYHPGMDSVIGKCGICGAQISCTVSEVE